MAEVVLFHHAQGLTSGCLALADELRAAGHVVHAPDLYDGQTFAELGDGIGYARQVGFDTILERGRAAAASLPPELVYAGLSLGVMPAQKLAQTRPGAKGAVLLHAAFPASEFGDAWPPAVPLQIHLMEDDEFALRGTSTPPASWTKRSRAQRCFCIRATGTCSPTAAWPTTTSTARRWSSSASSPSSTASSSCAYRATSV